MKNIHVIKTDKPSRLSILNSGKLNFGAEIMSLSNSKLLNIYITSDEEIKEGDWYLTRHNEIHKSKVIGTDTNGFHFCKKIILTTDQSLDGVQAIDDEFLEWFIKNPSCESVEIENTCLEVRVCDCAMNENCLKPGYKIIIPQEEPKDVVLGYKTSLDAQMLDSQYVDFSNPNADKITSASTTSIKEEAKRRAKNYMRLKDGYVEPKQETLEEAAKKIYGSDVSKDVEYYAFILGAKWQIDKQDNFIIGFLEFIEGTYSYSNIFDYWYLHADTSKTYTKKDLLKKYIDTLNGN